MTRDIIKAENKRRTGRSHAFITAAVIAFAGVVVFSFLFLTKSVNDNIIRANTESMEEMALHDENSIKNSVDLRLACMETIAQKLKTKRFADPAEMFMEMVKMAQSIPSADVLSFLDSEGTEYTSDGIVTKNSYLADVLKGRTESFITRVNTSAHLPELVREVLLEAVPIDLNVDGRRMEWLICLFPVDALENELKINSYEGKGFSSVIDEDGFYIINMSKVRKFLSRDNLFEDLSGAAFEGYESIERVCAAAAAADGATSAIYTQDGQKYIMVITAFDVADWFLVTIVPVSVFEAQTRVIIFRFVILLAIIAVILVIVILLIYRQRKERERAEEENRRREEMERIKLIEGITSAYNVAYVVDLSDDTFEMLRMDGDIIGHEKAFDNFTQAKEFFLQLLLPCDRDRMRRLLDYGGIRRMLAESKSFDAEYRVPIDGAMIWHTMNVTSIDADTVTIGFAVDDLGITKKHLEDKRFSEYFALYEVDTDTKSIKTVISSPFYTVSRPGKALPYEAAMKAFAGTLEGEASEYFTKIADIDVVKKAFAKEDKYSYTYRSNNLGNKWVDLTAFVTLRHEDGSPAMFTLGFTYIDSFGAAKQELQSRIAEQKTKLEEALTFTDFFLEPYESAYYVELNDLSWKAYKRTEALAKRYPAEGSYLEAMGRYIRDEVHPDYRAALSVITDPEKLRGVLAVEPRFTIDYRTISKEKETWYRCFAIRGASEDYVALTFIDITREIEEQRKREKELEDALAAAQSASRAKTNFLFSMSHDIRTPMNAITGFTAMAKKHIDDKAAVTDYLEKIDASGKQLLSLINNVLEMARIESGKLELDEKPVDIRREFATTTTVLSEQAQINGQEFNYSMEGIRHFNVYADTSKMNSVTLNILSNAFKYTPEGGRIDFRFKETAGRKPGCATYVLTVQDTGIGMSKAFLSTLFDPFSREKTSTVSGIQGTGLGMAIVKRIVDLMGGDIAVQSEPGKGTRFDVTLDFKISEEPVGEVRGMQTVQPASFRGLKVLLVEDNEMNREIAFDILKEEGFAVDAVEDGSIAVEILKKKGPDCYDFILMDIQMPVMNGYEATKAIRAMYPGARIPIIALSANAFEEDRRASKEAGMDDHVAKPIDVAVLKETMAKYL